VTTKYTTFFRSVIAFGRIHIIEDEAEKLSTARMLMIRFDIEHLTGKEAIELVKQRSIR